MNLSFKRSHHTKTYVLLILLSFGFSTLAQSPRTYTSKLQKVTVYLQGAHLYYNESVALQTGNNELVFENISPYINAASLQASSRGAIVMDIKHQVKYKEKVVATRKYDREIENVIDSLEDISYLMKDIDNKTYVLETEKTMLLNNRIIKGQPLRDSLALLRDGMAFLKEKLNSIYEQSLKLERQKNKLQKLKNKLEERHNTLVLLQSGNDYTNNAPAQPIHQVIVTLFSESPNNTTQVNFNYFANAANWIPVYDLQATSATNNFNLKYFANVTQNTGLEWTNVPLTLSTSNPNETNVKPEMSPWYLSFVDYMRKSYQTQGMSNSQVPMQKETVVFTDSKKITEDSEDDNSAYLQQYVQVTENIIRTEYEIKLNYTIAADGKMHKVLINQKEIPMKMEFAAVPKVCTDAFLMAKVTGWEDMNIIPGKARLYFDGAYVGEMYLNASTTSDTLSINLGRDKSIALTRKKIKENYKDKVLSDEKVETRTIEIVVRNTKSMPVEIQIEDQIPVVAGTNDIKVVLLESNGATLDEATGKLTWNIKLKVKDSEKLTFTYQIRYPKGKELAGL